MSAAAERFRLRHALPAARWPTAEEAARSRWFSPARIGPLTIAERTWVPGRAFSYSSPTILIMAGSGARSDFSLVIQIEIGSTLKK